jgi:hypothetical protein
MKLNVPERLEDFHDGDMVLWLNRATEELGTCAEALADNKITREQFAAIFQSFAISIATSIRCPSLMPRLFQRNSNSVA